MRFYSEGHKKRVKCFVCLLLLGKDRMHSAFSSCLSCLQPIVWVNEAVDDSRSSEETCKETDMHMLNESPAGRLGRNGWYGFERDWIEHDSKCRA